MQPCYMSGEIVSTKQKPCKAMTVGISQYFVLCLESFVFCNRNCATPTSYDAKQGSALDITPKKLTSNASLCQKCLLFLAKCVMPILLFEIWKDRFGYFSQTHLFNNS